MDTVLVIEDDSQFSIWVRDTLRQNFMVTPQHAATLSEARAKLREQTFSVILLDLILPDGFGIQLAPELAQHRLQTRLIVISKIDPYPLASSQRPLPRRLHQGITQLRPDAYLIKPFTADALVRAVRLTLHRLPHHNGEREV